MNHEELVPLEVRKGLLGRLKHILIGDSVVRKVCKDKRQLRSELIYYIEKYLKDDST